MKITSCSRFFSKNIATVYPDLDTQITIGHVGFVACEVHVSAKCLERDAPSFELFASCHIGTTKTSSAVHLDSEHIPISHRLIENLFHHTTERKSFFERFCHHAGENGCVGFRSTDCFHIDFHLCRSAKLQTSKEFR